MPIPLADTAYVPQEKLIEYLLNEHHPVGGAKAKWFLSLGYEPGSPSVLEQDLLKLVQTSDQHAAKTSPFGTKYVVVGSMSAPNGQEVNVITVWIVEPSDHRPRLVTAYPGDKP